MKYLILSQRAIENDSYPETREALDVRWGSFLSAAGFAPIPFPGHCPPDSFSSITNLAGVVLTGGNDLASFNPTPINSYRDKTDLALTNFALQNKLPLLGICRGMQFLAEHFGATLERLEGHAGTDHPIEVTRSGRLLCSENIPRTVNSYHDFGIIDGGEHFLSVSRSQDGSLEAIEHNEQVVAGIMWHPERYSTFKESDMKLFQHFFGGKK